MASDPTSGLRLLEPLAGELGSYAPFHLARADTYSRNGQIELALDAYRIAVDLAQNQVERDFLRGRIATMRGHT